MISKNRMDKIDKIANSYTKLFIIQRKSPINSTLILIIFCPLIIIQTYYFFNVIRYTQDNVFDAITINIFLFSGIILLYHPKKISSMDLVLFGITILITRFLFLPLIPEISSDLNRNLVFGSLFANGYNPYLWTLDQVPVLFDQIVLKVNYIAEWATHSYDYPAFATFFFGFISILSPADNFSAFLLAKSVLTFVEFLNAYIIYKIILRFISKNRNVALLTSIIYLLNPISIYMVTLEGQFEPLVIFFTLLFVYFLFLSQSEKSNEENRYFSPYLSGFFLGCAVLLKYYPLVYIPATLIVLRSSRNIKNFLGSFSMTLLIFSLPFITNSYYITNFIRFQLLRKDRNVYKSIGSIFGFNVDLFTILLLLLISLIILAIFKKNKIEFFIYFSTTTTILFILLNPSIFVWYSLWLFPFISLSHISYKKNTTENQHINVRITNFSWIIMLSIFLMIYTDPKLFGLFIEFTIFSYIITHQKFQYYLSFVLGINQDKVNIYVNKKINSSNSAEVADNRLAHKLDTERKRDPMIYTVNEGRKPNGFFDYIEKLAKEDPKK
ncbi:MAG: hypothetical protein HeimC3_43050 [Candidatus Heimdallarchaeota archaeon LC_3]|nr:MAG: hypothetical protein HeimC3_43050 [Candidatus Heimdallarchaeota archaeon LC_3]